MIFCCIKTLQTSFNYKISITFQHLLILTFILTHASKYSKQNFIENS